MIAVAVSLNLGIALFCFFVAWRLWRLTRTLGAAADALLSWERSIHKTINPAVTPATILRGQSGTARLRQRYEQLQIQRHRLERVMALVGMLPMANRWLGRRGLGGRLALAKRR